ncbi:MAG: hypothetical protein NT045_04030 [Candidatus Aureabacteria bacterium]|nr:hypothetical protein [Candidatus Auribacterota bacterium]
MSLASIKHTRYLLPAAPPAAILCAAFWDGWLATHHSRVVLRALSTARTFCIAVLVAAGVFSLLAPLWLAVASPILIWAIPLACACAIGFCAPDRLERSGSVFGLIAATVAIGFICYTQFATPSVSRKEEARPFVEAAEREAGGGTIVFYGINKDADGLKFLYWRKGKNRLIFTETRDALLKALAASPAPLLITPRKELDSLASFTGNRLQFLSEGRLGKRQCAILRDPEGLPRAAK